MKRLLVATTLIEVAAGAGLIALPVFAVRLLLGSELTGAGLPLGRVAGVALLALGVACWLASYDAQSCAARGVVSGMVIYNLGAALILGAAGLHSQPAGILLWPAVIVHAGMGIWCIASLLRQPPPKPS